MKRLRLSLNYNPGVPQSGLAKNTRNHRTSRCWAEIWSRDLPEYESVMLYIPLLCSVRIVLFIYCLFSDIVSDSMYMVLNGRMINPLKIKINLNYI